MVVDHLPRPAFEPEHVRGHDGRAADQFVTHDDGAIACERDGFATGDNFRLRGIAEDCGVTFEHERAATEYIPTGMHAG